VWRGSKPDAVQGTRSVLFIFILISVSGLQKLAHRCTLGNYPVVDPVVFQGGSLRDFLLAPACPMEKVTLWEGFLYLGDSLLAPACPIEKVTP